MAVSPQAESRVITDEEYRGMGHFKLEGGKRGKRKRALGNVLMYVSFS